MLGVAMTTLRSHTRRTGRGTFALTLLIVASACGSSSPTVPSQPCSFTLSASSQSFSSDGGTGAVTVSTGATCAWSVEGATGWVTLTSAPAVTGPGRVEFSVGANAGSAARDKTLAVAAAPFTVHQAAPDACTFTIEPERREIARRGGTAEVAVTTTPACAWTAASQVPWIAVGSGADGRGSGTVRYEVAENNATATRTGTVTIAGRTHTVDQDGETAPAPACEYRVTPVDFAPCMAAGTLTATVTTQASCEWTASPGESWLAVTSGRSGTGPGTITITYRDNYLAPRHGVVMVRWPTPSLGQNLHVEQAGCVYGVSRSTLDVAAAGGVASVDVLQQSMPNTCGGPLQDACVWTARADVSWIAVTTHMPQVGGSRGVVHGVGKHRRLRAHGSHRGERPDRDGEAAGALTGARAQRRTREDRARTRGAPGPRRDLRYFVTLFFVPAAAAGAGTPVGGPTTDA